MLDGSQGLDFNSPSFGVRNETSVEDLLNLGSAGKVGLIVAAGQDAFHETLIVIRRVTCGDFLPCAGIEIVARADAVGRRRAIGVDLDCAERAGDLQEQAIGVTAAPARRVDRA
jgi:hypothetical protein